MSIWCTQLTLSLFQHLIFRSFAKGATTIGHVASRICVSLTLFCLVEKQKTRGGFISEPTYTINKILVQPGDTQARSPLHHAGASGQSGNKQFVIIHDY